MKKVLSILLLITISLVAQTKKVVDTTSLPKLYLQPKKSFEFNGLIFSTKLSIWKSKREVLKVTMDDKIYFIPSGFCDCKKCVEFKGYKELNLNQE